MPASDLPLLIEAAQEAGLIATRYTGDSAKRWDKPGGLGPVTEADMAVNEMLERDLRAARPDYGWLSEETEDGAARLGREHVFIIDPIDGTRSFIDGSATWAHSLAVAEAGIVTAAVIYLPLRNKLYAAAAGQGATLNDAPITVSTRSRLSGAHVIAAKPNLDPGNWKAGRVPDVARAHRPSLAYRLSLVAEGRFDAMLTLRRSWEWDIAAGDLILREAGAVTSDRKGNPLCFNNAEPLLNGVVTANPALHRAILSELS
ncbi:3'(2'),5'-bisphosphate nucleotidase CysQ [Roseovarius sp. A21]|uniref:3'(2'),5'-bisphosphate nucleotidase CysQ n=1 Tax=Roseovarius bejariae TaxID=2576383 RepID=A0A844CLI1_9RHOB|nr:3'(2'),5'-bisphosphate nucleotidase CysQ [Roseovarius bejariae]MRU16181.1 3'(2'),5'-bisphosphate nucleotidase CysQ [Roseovarius bejariae]